MEGNFFLHPLITRAYGNQTSLLPTRDPGLVIRANQNWTLITEMGKCGPTMTNAASTRLNLCTMPEDWTGSTTENEWVKESHNVFEEQQSVTTPHSRGETDYPLSLYPVRGEIEFLHHSHPNPSRKTNKFPRNLLVCQVVQTRIWEYEAFNLKVSCYYCSHKVRW